MATEVWILGGAGRSGRVIATELMARGLTPVLVGRNPTRLAQVAQAITQTATEATFDLKIEPRTLVAASIDDMAAAIQRDQPAIVINTVGPFATTAKTIARACLAANSHYVDLANDVAAVTTVLDLDQAAQQGRRTLITGAGFGVTATESVVVQLMRQQPSTRPAPKNVRVDMIPSLATEPGPLGEALAATIVDGFPDAAGRARYQGRRYENGLLRKARLAGDPITLTLPDGTNVTTSAMPLGELVAAQRASGA
ncbi:MAG TPA: saccharopine dehydrogenase NADP-binding domain-containing protein, partial [Streptosporangiaceae bacterium]|nr:saccharopine dehydrogenase NADP-binding domain-containing protein [Streptosporangiaceae bacterium]